MNPSLQNLRTRWNHDSNLHTIEEECKEGCRFWPEEGEVSALEILEYYRGYQGFSEVYKSWLESDAKEI